MNERAYNERAYGERRTPPERVLDVLFEQAVSHDPGRDLRPRCQGQLVEDVAHVHIRRALGNHQRARNLPIGETASNKDGYLALARVNCPTAGCAVLAWSCSAAGRKFTVWGVSTVRPWGGPAIRQT